MQIISQNIKKGFVKLKVQSLDDLWYVNNLIEEGDIIRCQTIRKIKSGGEEDRKQTVFKKKVTLSIKIEKIDYKADLVRVGGEIAEGSEDIQKGSWHSVNIEEGTIFTLVKEDWLNYQLDWLKQASKQNIPKILICCFDREEAYFALLKRTGYEVLSHIKGKVAKKGVDENIKSNYYQDLVNNIREYDERLSLDKVIIASPSFWKEYLLKEIKDKKIKEKVIQATCSSVDKGGINEVLKRPEMATALKEERASEEGRAVDELLTEIKKQGKAAYGIKECEEAVNIGAVKKLLITSNFLIKSKKDKKVNELMKVVEQTKGDVAIISSENEGGRNLDSLGGVGALLRYKVN